jgi:hypothetical protein
VNPDAVGNPESFRGRLPAPSRDVSWNPESVRGCLLAMLFIGVGCSDLLDHLCITV